MVLRIYDSQDGVVKEFKPVEDGKVRMYVCGLTPYDNMHVGHLRTYVFFDMVRRYLEFLGYEVKYVQNITDVEDKIFKRAKELGVDPLELTHRVMKEALKEMEEMNIQRPTLLERVSDNIDAIERLIEKIIERGYAYENNGEVYYSVLKFKDYGKLSKQKIDELISGARIKPNENKKHPLDFALWKKSKDYELKYDSPWGEGRPGWHIECSAISTKYLGDTIDIHGGGRDLIFPHHENEIAQSEAATGKRFVNYWMHTGFLTINGEKMSKSLGNFITAREIIDKYPDTNVIRWYLLTRHYRSPIDFNYEKIDEVKTHMERLYSTIEFARAAIHLLKGTKDYSEEIKDIKGRFISAMDNDFDTPQALVAVNDLVKLLNKMITDVNTKGESVREGLEALLELLSVMGFRIKLKGDESYTKKLREEFPEVGGNSLEEMVNGLLERRIQLRKDKQFKEADEIRDKLSKAGIVLVDYGREYTLWRRGEVPSND